ncbi:hypothetical protein SCB71_06335 [Herbiconiux sp. KACC 21604]|uniref:phage major capsid protein n=1 Tax=unclassified Herbiconiux TaxID=2618217 RepID=UPI00149233ED|nr:hypothetical protein [Herbiconiux sp. SALV-R1]QJU52936.1 hypothetical protein HL652_04320 [Herbiconiux sp. SALV-R1]WPO87856.1 hypothetical protein SCB71_06335 [Herbiconiux sp. KACC 21604]
MPYTYPPAAPTLSGDTVTISRFLNNPTLIARRLRTLLEQRYIADALLTGRFNVEGGAVQYETGETIFTTDNPRAVAPGSEYSLTGLGTGTASIAKTVKWGQDAKITDEAIKRQGFNPVERGLTKLANQNVKYVDSVALSAISSAVTQTSAAAAAWTGATAAQIFKDVALAKASIVALNQGYDPDTVVVSDIAWANALSAFVAAGYFARESDADNPAITGNFPTINGLRWLVTPNLPTANTALVLDSASLGGMADEKLGGPGYASVNNVGVEVKSIRKEDTDSWRLRARRVTVPVVLEPAAAWKLTGIGA